MAKHWKVTTFDLSTVGTSATLFDRPYTSLEQRHGKVCSLHQCSAIYEPAPLRAHAQLCTFPFCTTGTPQFISYRSVQRENESTHCAVILVFLCETLALPIPAPCLATVVYISTTLLRIFLAGKLRQRLHIEMWAKWCFLNSALLSTQWWCPSEAFFFSFFFFWALW